MLSVGASCKDTTPRQTGILAASDDRGARAHAVAPASSTTITRSTRYNGKLEKVSSRGAGGETSREGRTDAMRAHRVCRGTGGNPPHRAADLAVTPPDPE